LAALFDADESMSTKSARRGRCILDSMSAPLNPVDQIEQAEQAQDLLTVEQAARHLRLSVSSIRSYIRQGRLKAFRIAGLHKVLIARKDLMGLLEPTNSGEAVSARGVYAREGMS
jgi:excisionase family DNA binding protein